MKKMLFAMCTCIIVMLAVLVVMPEKTPGFTVEAAAKVKLNKTNVYVSKGDTVRLSIIGTSKKVRWSSSNRKIAVVSNKGVVKGIKKGKATITAKVNGREYRCKVNVEIPSISKKSVSLDVGSFTTLKMKNTKQIVKWGSSNKKIATVNNKGKVKGIKDGKATITAKIGKKKYNCKVTVKKKVVNVSSVSLNESDVTLHVGESKTLKATVSPSNATNKTVTWSSSNNGIITVDEGVVRAIAPGTATVTAKVGSKKSTCKITVSKEDITYIGNRNVDYDSAGKCHRLFFSFLLSDGKTEVSSSGVANIKIVNNDGITVYNKSKCFTPNNFSYWNSALYGRRYLCSIEIPNNELMESTTTHGTLTFSVKLNDGKTFAQSSYNIFDLPLKAIEVESVVLDKTTLELYEGCSGNLTASVLPNNATNRNITWISSDNSIVTVDNGKYSAIAPGKAQITASAGGISATCEVIVKKNVTIQLENELPETFSNYGVGGRVYSKATVESCNYSCSTKRADGSCDITLDLLATKVYDEDISGNRWACRIDYKLYDLNGVLVDSGNFFVDTVAVGDVFHVKKNIYSLTEEEYILVLCDHR